jgi:hypothetical protein
VNNVNLMMQLRGQAAGDFRGLIMEAEGLGLIRVIGDSISLCAENDVVCGIIAAIAPTSVVPQPASTAANMASNPTAESLSSISSTTPQAPSGSDSRLQSSSASSPFLRIPTHLFPLINALRRRYAFESTSVTELSSELQAMRQPTGRFQPLLDEASELGMVVLSNGKVGLAPPPAHLAPFINVLRTNPPEARMSVAELCNEVTRVYRVPGKLRPRIDDAKNLGWISVSAKKKVALVYTST